MWHSKEKRSQRNFLISLAKMHYGDNASSVSANTLNHLGYFPQQDKNIE